MRVAVCGGGQKEDWCRLCCRRCPCSSDERTHSKGQYGDHLLTPTPALTVLNPRPRVRMDLLNQQIQQQGSIVRELKSKKADKAQVP